MKNRQFWLLVLLILSMCIWGASWSSAKVLSSYGSPMSITFLRFLMIPPTLLIFLKAAKISPLLNKKGWKHVLLAGTLMACYTLLFFGGLKRGSAGSGGVLVTVFIPIAAYLIGLLQSRKLPGKTALMGLLLGLIAGALLLNVWEDPREIFAQGNLYFIVAAALWAIMGKVTSVAAPFGHLVAFNMWLHIAAICALAYFVNYEEMQSIVQNGDSKFWANILYFGIINSSLATTTYFYATSRLGAEKASSFIFIVPSTAVLFSWLFLDEPVLLNTVIGGIIGLVAVFVINGKFSKK